MTIWECGVKKDAKQCIREDTRKYDPTDRHGTHDSFPRCLFWTIWPLPRARTDSLGAKCCRTIACEPAGQPRGKAYFAPLWFTPNPQFALLPSIRRYGHDRPIRF